MKKCSHVCLKFFLLFTFMLSIANCIYAEEANPWEIIMIKEPPAVMEEEITFLEEVPTINGILDKSLEFLPVRTFNAVFKEKKSKTTPISYRMAYGTSFLYLYIEADAEQMYFRDRAYQNGDGFVMLIAQPKPNNEPADEFYELACSAVNKPQQEWTRRIFWNYNVNKIFVVPSEQTKLEFHAENGKISFELLLPWDDVRPCHPWISESIGFNLSFCKGVEPNNSVWYTLLDGHTGSEFSKREYMTLKFQKPVLKGNPQTYLSFKQGHIQEGGTLDITAVTASNKELSENIMVLLRSAEGEYLGSKSVDYAITPGVTRKDFTYPVPKLTEGGYQLGWFSANKHYASFAGLTVLPKFNEESYKANLEKYKIKISKGTYTTLQFIIEDLQKKINALKPYEICYEERMILKKIDSYFAVMEKGKDPLAEKTGFSRKAYRSKLDNTMQPYVVYLPENYDKTKKYPLMVFLHGSASDETDIMGFKELIPADYIAVGPFGRGPSNGFTRDNAQEDIAEAIEAVQTDYPIDASRILLTGFSMGGYGVYRTFSETPDKFKAIAIFSGEVKLTNEYDPGLKAPDFSNPKNLKPFKSIPVFIFHGENDLNVSLPHVKDIYAKLKKAGAKVELFIEPNKGHARPEKETTEFFKKWVVQNMK